MVPNTTESREVLRYNRHQQLLYILIVFDSDRENRPKIFKIMTEDAAPDFKSVGSHVLFEFFPIHSERNCLTFNSTLRETFAVAVGSVRLGGGSQV
jgi:hypothetical protein